LEFSIAMAAVLLPSGGRAAEFEWTKGAPAPAPRVEALSAVIGNNLFVFGGFTTGMKALRRIDVYDAATDSWSQKNEMPFATTHQGATMVGKTFWATGGFKGDNPGKATDEVWKYDVTADVWSAGPPLPEPRGAGALACVESRLHFFGGFKSDRDTTCAEHWVLDVNGGTEWKRAADFPNARGHHTAVVLDGKIYSLGGQFQHDTKPQDLDVCSVYDPANDSWKSMAKLPFNRSHFEPGTFVRDGRIFIVGGRSNNTKSGPGVADVSMYDPKADTWSFVSKLPAPLVAPASALIGDKLIATCGGYNNPSPPQAETFIAKWALGESK
jgi:N-acetylneuraminic acid mutarotase